MESSAQTIKCSVTLQQVIWKDLVLISWIFHLSSTNSFEHTIQKHCVSTISHQFDINQKPASCAEKALENIHKCGIDFDRNASDLISDNEKKMCKINLSSEIIIINCSTHDSNLFQNVLRSKSIAHGLLRENNGMSRQLSIKTKWAWYGPWMKRFSKLFFNVLNIRWITKKIYCRSNLISESSIRVQSDSTRFHKFLFVERIFNATKSSRSSNEQWKNNANCNSSRANCRRF